MKRVFIIHGWASHPSDAWIPWLKDQLEKQGIAVMAPEMPHPDAPTINDWVSQLIKVIDHPDEETFIVAHSIGCQAVLRYLAQLPSSIKIGGVVCVGGWFTLKGLETDEEKALAKPWLETPIDFNQVKQHCANIVAFFSDNDPYVPLENVKLFEQNLNAKTIIEQNKFHYDGLHDIVELSKGSEELFKLTS